MAAAVRSLAWLELNINYVCQVYYNTAAFSPCHFTSFEPRSRNLNLQSQVQGGAENIEFPLSVWFCVDKEAVNRALSDSWCRMVLGKK